MIREEKEHIENQIKLLLPTRVGVTGQEFFVFHEMLFTMIDGKVCNAITSTSSAQVCYICRASFKEMNTIDGTVKRQVDITSLRFGLSTLHAWIRFFFKYFLHVAYRLDIKKWQARGDDDRRKVKKRKALIQKKFSSEISLLVGQAKPGGCGTINDGNTARRFFKVPSHSVNITGLSEMLIRRCAVILRTVSSGHNKCRGIRPVCQGNSRALGKSTLGTT